MNQRQKMIGMLFAGYPSLGESRAELEAQIGLYGLALEGVSNKNVELACKAFIQGRVSGHNPSFRPRPAELAEYARRLQDSDDRFAVQNNNITAQLQAPKHHDPTPEERQRVQDALNKLKKSLGQKQAEMIGPEGF